MFFVVYGEQRELRHASGIEPPEWGADYWEGEAENRTEARRKAVGSWLRQGSEQPWNQKITVACFETCPEHGSGCETADYFPCERGFYRFRGHCIFGEEEG